jgi:glycosyltransferase involved in cell wall biosynthesis
MDHLVERFEREYLPGCLYVTAASPGIAEAHSRKYGIPLPTTILNVFPLSERPQEFRPTQLDGTLRLYWFSQTIGEGRGLEDVIRAMGRLKGCNIELHLRGRWAARYEERLRSLARIVGIAASQICWHAPAPQGEMVRLAAVHDVGLATELRDTENHDLCIANKLFNYLLAGNAVIATATTGQQPVMQTIGDAGFSYQPGDVNMLARGLQFWYQDRNTLHRARQTSWEWGTRQFNWDVEKKKFLRTVERALQDR